MQSVENKKCGTDEPGVQQNTKCRKWKKKLEIDNRPEKKTFIAIINI